MEDYKSARLQNSVSESPRKLQDSSFNKKKIWLVTLLFLFLLLILTSGVAFYYWQRHRPQTVRLSTTTPLLQDEESISSSQTYFRATLEYDLKTEEVVQVETATFEADITQHPRGFSRPPGAGDNFLTYKTKVVGQDGTVFDEYWQVVQKSFAKGNRLPLYVTVPYQKGSIILLSLPSGKVFWVGEME